MAARPSWEGHLRLSLVTCPVTLYAATTEADAIRFNLINPQTNNRVRMKTTDAGTGEEVERSQLVKGYQVAKNQYVIFDQEEIDAVKIESTKILDIEEFVPLKSIDRLYWDTPFHLVPSGKTGIEAFAVIRAAMAKKGMVGIGRLVLSQRERICAIEPEEDGMRLTTLRTAGEVRPLAEVAHDLPKPDPRMLEIAEKIVEQQRAEFDPSQFRDRYADALRDLIERKKKGQPVTAASVANDDSPVIDLMEALRKSLGGKGGARQRAERFAASPKGKAKKAGGRRAA